MDTLTIDCARCSARGANCADCIVTALLGPGNGVQLTSDELSAMQALAAEGLVAPLRLPASDRGGDCDHGVAFAATA
jgi:hypothetical protein